MVDCIEFNSIVFFHNIINKNNSYYFNCNKKGDNMSVKLNFDHTFLKEKPIGRGYGIISNRLASNTVEMDIQDIAEAVGSRGDTFTAAFDKELSADRFISMQLIAIDFDNDKDIVTYAQIVNRSKKYSLEISFAYYTLSSTDEHVRFRVVFMLETAITDVSIAGFLIEMLLRVFPEADQKCKNVTRYFLGGKGLISCPFGICKINSIVRAGERRIFENDRSRNATGTVADIAKKYCIGYSGKFFEVFSADEYEKNNANVSAPIYIYKEEDKNALICVINRYTEKNENITENSISKEPEKNGLFNRENPRIIKKNTCRLMERAMNPDGFNALNHSEHMVLMSNLLHIKGGEKLFLSWIEASNSDKTKWKYDIEYHKKLGYYRSKCDRNCRFCDECDHGNTMLDTLKECKNAIVRKNEINYVSLQDAESELKSTFEKCIESDDSGIHIIKAQTGLGKTYVYRSYIKEHLGQYKYLIAVPFNNLKNEIKTDMQALGIKVLSSVSLEDLKSILCEIEYDEIKKLYNRGYDKEARRKIKKFKNQNESKLSSPQKIMIDIFLNLEDYMKKDDYDVIITTHQRFLRFSSETLSEYKVIIDEDILHTIFTSQREIITSEVTDLWTDFSGDIKKDEKEKLKWLLDLEKNKFLPYPFFCAPDLNNRIAKKYDHFSNFRNLDKTCMVVKESNNIIKYLAKPMIPSDKIIVLSATADEELYRKYFADTSVEVYEITKARYKGKVIQYTKYTMSRNDLNKKETKKLVKTIKKIVEHDDYNTISFKKEKTLDPSAHFGHTEGSNAYKNSDLVIIGTPHLHPNAYYLIAALLEGNKSRDYSIYNHRISNGFYEYVFNSFKDNLLQRIQLYFVETELEQSVGRARLLRNDNTVYVFSNYPVDQAQFIYKDYLA